MKNLKTLLEASLLADIEDTIDTGNTYENINLTSLFNSKSKEEFETKYNIFRSMFEEKNTEVSDIKPKKTYIAFVKNILRKEDQRLCSVSVYIGTTTYLYRLTWITDSRNGKDRTIIWKMASSANIDNFTRKYNDFEIAIYVCPKKIKDEANKLIIHNLELI